MPQDNIDSPENIATIAQALQLKFNLEDEDAVRVAHGLLELVEEPGEEALETPEVEEAEEAGAMTIMEAKEGRPDRRSLEGALYGTAKGLLSNSNVGSTKKELKDLIKSESGRYGDDWAARIIGRSIVDSLSGVRTSDSLGKVGAAVPQKVKEIAEAIAREHPEYTMEQKFKMAWAQYKRMKSKKEKFPKTAHIRLAAISGARPGILAKIARGDIPKKVKEIADAIRRDNPETSDEIAYREAWETYCSYVNRDHPGCTAKGKTRRKTPKREYAKAAQANQTDQTANASTETTPAEPPPAKEPTTEKPTKPEEKPTARRVGVIPTGDTKRKKSKKQTNYKSDRGTKKKNCGNCKYFNSGSNTCDEVSGYIVSSGLSDIWAPR